LVTLLFSDSGSLTNGKTAFEKREGLESFAFRINGTNAVFIITVEFAPDFLPSILAKKRKACAFHELSGVVPVISSQNAALGT
jgi:hypothetical protein